MSKNFYVVIPYSPAPVNIKGGISAMLGTSAASSKKQSSERKLEEERIQLEQRVSLVIEGLSSMGVKTVTLSNDDLVELFYHIYNPTDPTGNAPALNT